MVYIYTHTFFLWSFFKIQQWFETITSDSRTYHPGAFMVCSDVCSTSQIHTVPVPHSLLWLSCRWANGKMVQGVTREHPRQSGWKLCLEFKCPWLHDRSLNSHCSLSICPLPHNFNIFSLAWLHWFSQFRFSRNQLFSSGWQLSVVTSQIQCSQRRHFPTHRAIRCPVSIERGQDKIT